MKDKIYYFFVKLRTNDEKKILLLSSGSIITINMHIEIKLV